MPTSRDLRIGLRLCRFYRVTTAAIEAEHEGVSHITMEKILDRLCDKAKLLNRLSAQAAEVGPITEPLLSWYPGDPYPDCPHLSNLARKRWEHNPVRPQKVYVASKRLLNFYGLPPRKRMNLREQATHELGCTRMWAFANATWAQWEYRNEELFSPFRGHAEGVEDAMLVDGDRIMHILEYSGAYRTQRVVHFVDHVIERNLSFSLF